MNACAALVQLGDSASNTSYVTVCGTPVVVGYCPFPERVVEGQCAQMTAVASDIQTETD